MSAVPGFDWGRSRRLSSSTPDSRRRAARAALACQSPRVPLPSHFLAKSAKSEPRTIRSDSAELPRSAGRTLTVLPSFLSPFPSSPFSPLFFPWGSRACRPRVRKPPLFRKMQELIPCERLVSPRTRLPPTDRAARRKNAPIALSKPDGMVTRGLRNSQTRDVRQWWTSISSLQRQASTLLFQ